MGLTETEQLHEDISSLRATIEAAIDTGADEVLLSACAHVLRGRLDRLEALDEPDD